jgi:hypothetical protein
MAITISGVVTITGVMSVGATPAANSGFALFGGGINNSSAYIATTNAYTYPTNVVTSGTSLGQSRNQLGAASNHTTGVFGGGETTGNTSSNYIDIYTFSNNSIVAGSTTNFTARIDLSAAGNATVAMFGSASGTTSTSLFTYGTSTFATGTTAPTAIEGYAAIGNSTDGFFAGGDLSGILTTIRDYNYSGATWSTPSATLSTAVWLLAAIGTTTAGYYAGGQTTGSGSSAIHNVQKLTYSPAAVTAGTNLGQVQTQLSGGSNTVNGVVGAGYSSGLNQTTATWTYTFSGDTVAAGTNLNFASAPSEQACCSSNPGGF